MTIFLAAAIEVIEMVAIVAVAVAVAVAVGSARSWRPVLTGACIRRRSEGRHTGPNRGVRVPAMPADRLPAGQQRTAAGADRPERSPALGGSPSAAFRTRLEPRVA
jgi:hypothetical protein